MVIDRARNFWHQSLPAGKGLVFGSSAVISDQAWTVNDTTVNGPGGGTYYTWSEIPGFSAFGSYQGTSNDDGPIIYTGFKVSFLLIQRFDDNLGSKWVVIDSTTYPFNQSLTPFFSAQEEKRESTTSEATTDFLANGFKLRAKEYETNNSSSQYIYAAFAENPFQSPATAR